MKLTAAPLACLLATASLAASAFAADVTSTWNGTTGNWSDASRWSSVDFPNNGNGGFTYDAIINSGNVTLDLNVTIEAFNFGGGALTGANDLTSNTLFTFSTGILSGAGTTFAAGGLTLGTPTTKFLDGGRTLVNQGTATWSDGQINLNGIGAVGSGIVINAAGAEFNNTFNGSLMVSSFGGDTGANSRFDNEGTFRKSGGTGVTSINTRFNNTGTVEVLTGTLEFIGHVPQHSGTMLTGGTWRSISNGNAPAITFSGSAIDRIGAGALVELSGPSSVIQVGTTPLHNTLHQNDGTMQITNGHSFSPLAATFTNNGALELGSSGMVGGVFTPAPLLQNNGTISGHGQINDHVISGGSIQGESDSQLVEINGLLEGAGSLKNVQINGTHSPGLAGAEVATVPLDGLYILNSAAALHIDIGRGLSEFEHDQLNSIGTVSISGHLALEIRNLGGGIFIPSVGQQFPIITATGGITGTFFESMFTTLASGVEIDWTVVYGGQEVALEASSIFVPIPGDYNRNEFVDAADYVVWRKSLGTSELTSDGNQNGEIDSGDFDVWCAHFGETTDGGLAASATIPEPATALLILLFAGAGGFIRRRFVSRISQLVGM